MRKDNAIQILSNSESNSDTNSLFQELSRRSLYQGLGYNIAYLHEGLHRPSFIRTISLPEYEEAMLRKSGEKVETPPPKYEELSFFS